MLRSDFENHPVWPVNEAVRARIETIRPTAEPTEIATMETIGFYSDHIATFRQMSTTSSALFVDAMLTPVREQLDTVVAQLDNRISLGPGSSNLEVARVEIEAALVQIGPWPRPYAKGAQIQQMSTLYEDLLERQRLDLETLDHNHQLLRDEVTAFSQEISDVAITARSDLSSILDTATDANATVNAEKTRVDELVSAGVKQLAEMSKELDVRAKAWQELEEANFDKKFKPYLEQLQKLSASARESFELLRRTESDFANLSAAAATDKLAGHFGTESKGGRRAGTWLYVAGAVFIALAALPLLLLLMPGNLSSNRDIRWEQLVIRAGIGIAAASGATVAIRLGGRFFANANVTKRMELDLKTFGPFLANVPSTVANKARINLVERALGKAEPGTTATVDEVASIGEMTQLIDAIAKIVTR